MCCSMQSGRRFGLRAGVLFRRLWSPRQCGSLHSVKFALRWQVLAQQADQLEFPTIEFRGRGEQPQAGPCDSDNTVSDNKERFRP